MKKNIILVDRNATTGLSVIEKICLDTNFYIAVLIVDNSHQKQLLSQHNNIGEIFDIAEIDNWNSVKNLDFDTLVDMREAQLRAENSLTRYTEDYNERKYRYYHAFSFWAGIFERITPDVIIINDIFHGFLYDSIPFVYAKSHAVPMLTANNIGVNRWNAFFYDYTNKIMLKINNEKRIDVINEYLVNGNHDVLHFDFDMAEKRKKKTIKQCCQDIIYGVGGFIGVGFGAGLVHLDINRKQRIASSGFFSTPWRNLWCYCKTLRDRRFLYSIERKINIQEEKHYIYYSLHFEPEGSIQCRVTMESQLIAIKMLSEALPKGWKIFVKEHPHQFKINNYLMGYHIQSICLFKTREFYEILSGIPNVYIVSHKYGAHELIKKATAVATMLGSVLLEAVQYGKPAFVFSEMHPFANSEEFLRVRSYDDCKRGMDKLLRGFVPDYGGVLSLLNEYVCASGEDYVNNYISIIKKYE